MPLTDTEVQKAYKLVYSPLTGGAQLQSERVEAKAQLTQHFVNAQKAQEIATAISQPDAYANIIAQAEKAFKHDLQNGLRKRPADRMTIDHDPNGTMVEIPGLKSKRNKMPGFVSRAISRNNPVIASLIGNANNRSAGFGTYTPPTMEHLMNQTEGFDVVLKGSNSREALTPESPSWSEYQEIVEFIRNSGDRSRFPTDGGPTSADLRRDPLPVLITKYTTARFVSDDASFEIQRRYGGELAGIYSVDGDSIYQAQQPWEAGYITSRFAKDYPRAMYAQVYNQRIYAALTSQQLLYDVANVTDDPQIGPYGVSETEKTVRLTQAVLNILNSGNALFDRNAMPEGILTIKGVLSSEESLTYLTDDYNSYRLGAGGQYGLPMVALKDPSADVKFVQMGKPIVDLGMEGYMTTSVGLTCGIFGADVQEVNASPMGGNNSNLGGGSTTEARANQSNGRWFHPHISRLFRLLNTMYSGKLGDKWEIIPRGLIKYEPKLLMDVVTSGISVNEARRIFLGLGPVKDTMVGESLLNNPAIAQMTIANQAKEAAASGKPKK